MDNELRSNFPSINNNIVYLDNAATTYKPQNVINVFAYNYGEPYSSVGRGDYKSSYECGLTYQKSREKIVNYLRGNNTYDLIFTNNCTDSMNLLALSIETKISKGVAVDIIAHHSCSMPFANVCKAAEKRYLTIDIDKNFQVSFDMLTENIDLYDYVVLTHMSNVLGIQNNYDKLIEYLHSYGKMVIIDAAQSVGHTIFDAINLDADAIAFSAHKMMGPLGIGGLLIKNTFLDIMSPCKFGGGMVIDSIKCIYKNGIDAFEVGTQDWISALAWEKSVDFLLNLDRLRAFTHIKSLCQYFHTNMKKNTRYKPIIDYDNISADIISFNIEGYHCHDIGALLNFNNINVRVGNMCAQPLFRRLEVPYCVRLSPYLYNTYEEIDRCIWVLSQVK